MNKSKAILVKVTPETHMKIKIEALKHHMNVQQYMEMLVEIGI